MENSESRSIGSSIPTVLRRRFTGVGNKVWTWLPSSPQRMHWIRPGYRDSVCPSENLPSDLSIKFRFARDRQRPLTPFEPVCYHG